MALIMLKYAQLCLTLFATPQTVACQAPLSIGFSRHAYWSRLPFLLLVDLPDPGFQPACTVSPELQADSLSLSHWGSPYVEIHFLCTHFDESFLSWINTEFYQIGDFCVIFILSCVTVVYHIDWLAYVEPSL